jgi:hypothetical protein
MVKAALQVRALGVQASQEIPMSEQTIRGWYWVVIDAFVEQLQKQYEQTYGMLEPGNPGIIGFIARLAMENIANSDAPYHDMNHTAMVTLVGQEILRGKHITEGGVTPRDWLHFIISLLCHDIGYVRGVCRGDGNGRYICDDRCPLIT